MNATVSADTVLSGWSPEVNPSPTFDTVTGTFTAPTTGVYVFDVSANIAPAATVTTQAAPGSQHSLDLRVNAMPVASANFPMTDIDILLLLSLRVPTAGHVSFTAPVQLNAGDQVDLAYVAGGFTLGFNLTDVGLTVTALS